MSDQAEDFPTHCHCGQPVQPEGATDHRCRQCADHCELEAYRREHGLPSPTPGAVGPDLEDVAQLTALLDLMADFPSNEQRARYLLTSNWLRERGAAAADLNAQQLEAVRRRGAERTGS